MSGSLAIGYQFPLEGRVACASRRSTVLSIHLQVGGASVRLIAVPERCLPGVKPPQFWNIWKILKRLTWFVLVLEFIFANIGKRKRR